LIGGPRPNYDGAFEELDGYGGPLFEPNAELLLLPPVLDPCIEMCPVAEDYFLKLRNLVIMRYTLSF
jgi:hypothetical protein